MWHLFPGYTFGFVPAMICSFTRCKAKSAFKLAAKMLEKTKNRSWIIEFVIMVNSLEFKLASEQFEIR